ncbi:hypothetical protein HWB76_gp063 [Streptomyces phage Blueeyedbeauty]|uniref:Uncharacterized protein n=1 Tax=Streptomyces phage Blueeyedbeauty TaxID=2250336 RepID=A0A345L235_9CAUD|nr:hypothetical protein HWB76_gp063 [Streptomyces phage Blueeyedbeauty]AXH49337.1 hypothetical protein SEA_BLUEEYEDBEAUTY_230 [Streptomyces phage Blueeyedbeauty]
MKFNGHIVAGFVSLGFCHGIAEGAIEFFKAGDYFLSIMFTVLAMTIFSLGFHLLQFGFTKK